MRCYYPFNSTVRTKVNEIPQAKWATCKKGLEPMPGARNPSILGKNAVNRDLGKLLCETLPPAQTFRPAPKADDATVSPFTGQFQQAGVMYMRPAPLRARRFRKQEEQPHTEGL
jgi:hypothetical protein